MCISLCAPQMKQLPVQGASEIYWAEWWGGGYFDKGFLSPQKKVEEYHVFKHQQEDGGGPIGHCYLLWAKVLIMQMGGKPLWAVTLTTTWGRLPLPALPLGEMSGSLGVRCAEWFCHLQSPKAALYVLRVHLNKDKCLCTVKHLSYFSLAIWQIGLFHWNCTYGKHSSGWESLKKLSCPALCKFWKESFVETIKPQIANAQRSWAPPWFADVHSQQQQQQQLQNEATDLCCCY